jgi:Mu transposase, C-terminal
MKLALFLLRQELQGGVSFDLPPDRMAFWTSFLPEKRRRLLKDGIHFEKIRYWSDVLARDLGRGGEMLVKYDPRDLSRVFVLPTATMSRLGTATWPTPQSHSGNGDMPSSVCSRWANATSMRKRSSLRWLCSDGRSSDQGSQNRTVDRVCARSARSRATPIPLRPPSFDTAVRACHLCA